MEPPVARIFLEKDNNVHEGKLIQHFCRSRSGRLDLVDEKYEEIRRILMSGTDRRSRPVFCEGKGALWATGPD
jgi:hypothetical protein